MFSTSKSNSNTKVTLKGSLGDYIERGAKWCKLADLEGTYERGSRPIVGWILKRDKFADPNAEGIDKLNVYLVIDSEDEAPILARLPKVLGKHLVEDYEKYLDELNIYDPEDAFSFYLGGASLKRVRTYNTKYHTPTATYDLWD